MRVENLAGMKDGRRLGRKKGDGGEKRIRAENWEDKVDGGEIGEEGGGRWNKGAREMKMTETRWPGQNRGREREMKKS